MFTLMGWSVAQNNHNYTKKGVVQHRGQNWLRKCFSRLSLHYHGRMEFKRLMLTKMRDCEEESHLLKIKHLMQCSTLNL